MSQVIQLYKGDSKNFKFNVWKTSQVRFPLVGYVGEFKIWLDGDDESNTVFTLSTNNSSEGIISGDENEVLIFYVNSSHTDSLESNRQYKFKVKIIQGSLIQHTLIESKIQVL